MSSNVQEAVPSSIWLSHIAKLGEVSENIDMRFLFSLTKTFATSEREANS